MNDASPAMRERILAHATRLFAMYGFAGTSVQSIAEAVGIRKPSLLYHFPSKAALRRDVLEAVLVHFKTELPRVLSSASTGKDRFASAIAALVDYFADHPDHARLLLRELLDHPADIRALLVEHVQPWTDLITDYVRMGQSAGRVRTDLDPEAYLLHVVHLAVATSATGPVTRAMFGRPDRPDGPDADAQVAELVRIARTALFNNRPTDQ